jgi:hypothetical protein
VQETAAIAFSGIPGSRLKRVHTAIGVPGFLKAAAEGASLIGVPTVRVCVTSARLLGLLGGD